MAVNRTWAAANPVIVQKFLDVYVKSIAWFSDVKNRDEAVRMMIETSRLKQEDVEKAYDFLRDKKLFEPTGKVSKAKLGSVVDALRELGDIPADFQIERLLLPGITQVTD
jgi:ABC-type nitrate/sulfonate/bicarbonate transport system substrate-binding protein